MLPGLSLVQSILYILNQLSSSVTNKLTLRMLNGTWYCAEPLTFIVSFNPHNTQKI